MGLHVQSGISILKVKVQVYSLISSLKTYHPNLHLTPWSLDLFIRVPFQLHGSYEPDTSLKTQNVDQMLIYLWHTVF